MTHPALRAGGVAVVTGAASGIGRAAAVRFATLGMCVALADLDGPALDRANDEVAGAAPGGAVDVLAMPTDVARIEDVERLGAAVAERLGAVSLLLNNAAIDRGAAVWAGRERWQRLLDVNLFGVINGLQTFVPGMIQHGGPGAIVVTGSKQGITTPPGNAAYNVSKAALKVLTEQLAHELRQRPDNRLSAHLLIPGFTFTGLTSPGLTESTPKPADAWTPEQVVNVLVDGMARGDFYLFCQDHETTREMDQKRMRWSADDPILNRPALSRWHPDFADAFAEWMRAPTTD